MTLQVDQLQELSSWYPAKKMHSTYLSPRDVRRDDKLYVPVPKDPQNHPPEIPLREATPAFEQLRRRVFLALFVPGPGFATVFACVDVFCVLLLLPAFVW